MKVAGEVRASRASVYTNAETSRFACWWPRPQTPFHANFIRGCAPFRRFFLALTRSDFHFFCLRRPRRHSKIDLTDQLIPSLFFRKIAFGAGRIFYKARRAAASVKRCPRGMGKLPHQAKRVISGPPEMTRFLHLWPQMPCLLK